MADVAVDVKGLEEVLKKMGVAAEDIARAVAAATYQEGFALMAKSKPQVPVDTGRLRQTGYVAPPTGSPAVTEVGYGTEYASAVHDKLEVHHPVGNAEYLKRPFDAIQTGYAARLAKRAADNWKKGVGVDSIPAIEPTKPEK